MKLSVQDNHGERASAHRPRCRLGWNVLLLLTAAGAVPSGVSGGLAQEKRIEPIPAQDVGKPAEFASFGATGKFYRVRDVKPGTPMMFVLRSRDVPLLQPDSLRLFRLDEKKQRWKVLRDSRYNAQAESIEGRVPGPGIYSVVGASRFEEVYDIQRRFCGNPKPRIIPEICKVILCPSEGFAGLAPAMMSEVPEGIEPRWLAAAMGNICEQCLGQERGVPDFPECEIPEIIKPPLIAGDLIPWPIKTFCFDASNGCSPGPHRVGQVDYDFPDSLDLIPTGLTTAAYPDVDVRATVRYPATSAGVGTPIAGTARYPIVLFLHGNHVTCPCSCSHSCTAASRVPSHLGYGYLQDILASWGFIAVSIDAFDVTCAWSPDMSDYEARGRLVLHHLARWRDWDVSGTGPWGGFFQNRVDMTRVGLSGHSRGGEGVVAAEYINRSEVLGFQIKAVNAIAPTDQDPYLDYVPQAPYFLLLAASDGDVSNLQGLRTYDRTSPAGVAPQVEKSMLWVYGANHNFFNTMWTPSFGSACSSDDGIGLGRISESLQRLVACQSIVPFFRLHLKNETGFRKLFRGEVTVEGLDGVGMYWTLQSPTRLDLDDFETGDNPASNALGGAVITSGGFATMNEHEFKSGGPDIYNSSFRHFTHGLVLGWNTTQTYETVLPVAQRNVSTYGALALRMSQILDGEVLNPLDAPKTFRVSLRTSTGTIANVEFDVAGIQSIPYPYEYNGGKTVLGMVRIPLTSFRDGNVALPLTDIERVILQFRGTGLVAVDDLQFTK